MELVVAYPNVIDLRKNLISSYSFQSKHPSEGNCIVFPEDIGLGTISTFERHGLHFMRGIWNCKHETSFRSVNPVGKSDLIDFRIGKSGEVRSAYLEGCKKYEWDISQVDGIRIMIPTAIISSKKPDMLDKFQRYTLDLNIKQLINDLLSFSADNFLNTVRMEWKFLELSYHWIDYFNRKDISSNFFEIPLFHVEAVENATDILLMNIKKPPTIKELGKLVGLNQQYLKVGFKKINGITIHQFLINERMKTAKELIQKDVIPISEVSLRVGYTDSGHFSKTYKKFYGTTPLQHRSLVS